MGRKATSLIFPETLTDTTNSAKNREMTTVRVYHGQFHYLFIGFQTGIMNTDD